MWIYLILLIISLQDPIWCYNVLYNILGSIWVCIDFFCLISIILCIVFKNKDAK